MRILQTSMAWIASLAMVVGTAGAEGCGGSKDSSSAAAPVAQQSSAAPGNTSAPAPAQGNPPAGQQDNGAAPQQAMATPEMNLTPDGLDELLSPIALYPDPVLAVMLQASTNPQEVMDGGNWLAISDNQNLKEAALDQASSKAGFTPVMQALLHYPTVVDLMCTQFDWTKQLGSAYAADPRSVLAAVQRLRAQAVDSGVLKTSPQMKVEVKQDQGQQIVALEPANPKVVYVPQYNPEQVFTQPPATTTTTTTTVVKEKEGVSTGTAVLIGLLSFGAGIAVGSAINSNNYYYPAWGYGGIYYGPRPYYPPPYRPYYGGGWGGGYYYNRPVHYGNNNIYINNTNNYYNRFNGNKNLQNNYRPTPYNNYRNPNNGVYAKSYGNQPTYKNGMHYQPKNDNRYTGANNGNNNFRGQNSYNKGGNNNAANNRPTVNPGNVPNNMQRPNTGNQQLPAQRPAPGNANNANNWKGQQTYQGNRGGNNANNAGNMQRPSPGGATPGNIQRPSPGNQPANGQRPNINTPTGSNVDRGWGNQGNRPSTGNAQANRPSPGNTPSTRPAPSQNQMQSRPAQQPASRPQSSNGGAFNGANNAKADRSASSRGRSSMGAPPMKQQSAGGAKKR